MNIPLIEKAFDTSTSIIQKVELPLLQSRNIRLFVKRDDLIDEFVSGNKWRKLKFNIQTALNHKNDTILTFGGAFSNHLLATAFACNRLGLKSIGLVRGDELNPESNEILSKCAENGMRLVFVSREEYSVRNEKFYHEELHLNYHNSFIIPEGGANYYGIIGCQEILKETINDFDHVFIAQGTTTTSIGVAFSINEESTLHVVPVLKGFDSIHEMKSLLKYSGFEKEFIDEMLEKIVVHTEAHEGGYAKYSDELLNEMESFFKTTKIPLDPIYTGKVIKEIFSWIQRENLHDCSVLFIHTGGIYGGKSIALKEDREFF